VIVRVVRRSSPDVDRRLDPRYEVETRGHIEGRNEAVTIKDISRGGAHLAPGASLSKGETGRLKISNADASFRVLASGKDGAHVKFQDAGTQFERTVDNLTANRVALPDPGRKAS